MNGWKGWKKSENSFLWHGTNAWVSSTSQFGSSGCFRAAEQCRRVPPSVAVAEALAVPSAWWVAWGRPHRPLRTIINTIIIIIISNIALSASTSTRRPSTVSILCPKVSIWIFLTYFDNSYPYKIRWLPSKFFDYSLHYSNRMNVPGNCPLWNLKK